MSQKIPLFKIYWDQKDVEAVTKIIKSGSYWATGAVIGEFEKRIAQYVGTKYALVFNSGTSALHALLLAYEISPADEVIVPSFTFIATANAILFVNAQPVFGEIEDQTYGLNAADVERKITKKTRAIIPIHYAGCACLDIKKLKKIAKKNNLLLIEDAAHSLGARIGNQKVGTFGDAAMFSLCQDKTVTTGEGGIIVTDSKKIYEKLKLIRSHGRAETADYFSSAEYMDYVTLGYNFRMPTIIAALGLSQFRKIDKIIKMRRQKATHYSASLSKTKGISLPFTPKNFFHIYQKYTIKVGNGLRDDLKNFLAQKGILSKVYFDPVHLYKFYREKFGFKKESLPLTERISGEVLSLPIYPSLKKREINMIVKTIKEFMRKYG